MRRLLLLFPVLLLASGCTLSPDVVTAEQGVDNANKQVAAAKRITVRADAQAFSSAAQSYASQEGTVAGFAADLEQYDPNLASRALSLTDTEVVLQIVPGLCLTQPLPAGAPTESDC